MDLVVEIFHVFLDFGGIFKAGGVAPYFGGEAGVGDGESEVGG